MAKRIEDYALIGDFQSAALVSRDGSIDWLCWPRFDSGALFASLLGSPDNGQWSLRAEGEAGRISRKYRQNTLIVETEIEAAGGAVSVIDFMPLGAGGISHAVRIVEGTRGTVEMVTEFSLRFDSGLIVPWVTQLEGGGVKAVAGGDMAVMRTTVPMKAGGYKHRGEFTVEAGERISFVLSYGQSFRDEPAPIDAWQSLKDTEEAWKDWSKGFHPNGEYSDAMLRSLITLKALTYQRTGGIIAAPTTSLPEKIGGHRNWDYRYCWLRDATFTLLALLNSGFHREATEWRRWLQRVVAGSANQMQIVYGLTGERRLIESEMPWLSGFENSRPVRVGNAAYKQLQIDVFGEVMDALFQGAVSGLADYLEAWPMQKNLVEHLSTIWRHPDSGFWEVRGGPRQFTHSKVMAWAALDRAIQSVERFGLDGPVDDWRKLRKHIHDQVCRNGYDPELGAFVQSYGSAELDASSLLMAHVGFLPVSDPRVASTVDAIGSKLKWGRLIRRYNPHSGADGVGGGEGVFLACSFWYVDNLAMLGRWEEAVELFEHLLSLRNDVGLLSEEYDPDTGRMTGNFPQGFSHVALVNTARHLSGPNSRHSHVHRGKPRRRS